jgi:maltooligosyltrehalose synthase
VSDASQWPLGQETWGDTRLALPQRASAWRNVLTGERLAARATEGELRLDVGAVLSTLPLALLESA